MPDITGSIYPALQYLDSQLESQTGVSKQTQGIDANALQNQSATAVAQVFSTSQMRMKLIARIIAEGVKDMFSLLHGTIRKYGDAAETVRLRNKWVQVNPREWLERNDMTIEVGLGTGSKTERVMHLMQIINLQSQAIQAGKTNLVDDVKLFNSASELAKLLEYKDPNRFFNDPMEKDEMGQLAHPPPPPQVDPKVQQMQLQAQLDMQQADHKAKIETLQAQADIATQDRKTQAEMIQSEREFQLKKDLAVMQAQLDMEKFNREQARKDHELALKAQMGEADRMDKAQERQSKSEGDDNKLSAVLSTIGEQLSRHSEMTLAAIKESNRPKRVVYGPNGKPSHTEPM